jgi:antitoxin ParD1/3/4
MVVTLTPQIEAMIQQRLETGRYSDASEVVREALRLLEERDREAQLAHVRARVLEGLESARRGELIEFNEEYLEQLDRDVEEAFLRGDTPDPDVCP